MPLANAGFGVGHDNWKLGDVSPLAGKENERMKMN